MNRRRKNDDFELMTDKSEKKIKCRGFFFLFSSAETLFLNRLESLLKFEEIEYQL